MDLNDLESLLNQWKKKNKRIKERKKESPHKGGLFYLSLFFQISEILINLRMRCQTKDRVNVF